MYINIFCIFIAVFSLSTSSSLASEFGKGLVEESPEKYKNFDTVPRFRAYLPPEVDLSFRFPTPGSQGSQGSCTAWATGYALRSYHEGINRRWDNFSSSSQTFSPSYIYNRIHRNGSCSGTAISVALDLLKNEGVVPFSDFPYNAQDCSRQPEPEQIKDARQNRIKSWRALNVSKIDDAKGQLASGNPVVFGMNISDSFDNIRGDFIYDDITSPRTGGHAMVLVGYSDAKQAFKLINSWGTRWGDKGYAWVSYRAVRALSQNQFVIDGLVSPPVPPVVPVKIVVEPTPIPTPVLVVPPAPKPIPIPSIVELSAQINALVNKVQCSKIDANLTPERVVKLTGFLGGKSDLQELQKSIGALPSVKRVDSDLKVRPWPQCEVYLNFAETMATPQGLSIALKGGKGSDFTEGNSLVVEVTTPAYPSYVYISYLQASGEVAHLYWPADRFPKPVAPSSKLTFGGGENGQPIYRVGPPYGDEIIVVTTSASPLFQDSLPNNDSDRAYLTDFRRAFALRPKSGGGERIVSTVVAPLRTYSK